MDIGDVVKVIKAIDRIKDLVEGKQSARMELAKEIYVGLAINYPSDNALLTDVRESLWARAMTHADFVRLKLAEKKTDIIKEAEERDQMMIDFEGEQ